MTRFDKPRFRAVFGAALLLVAAGFAGDAARAVCVGDCNDDGKVIISEVQRCVNIKNNPATIDTCRNADQNNDGTVTQSEVDNCISSFLDAASCAQVDATPTPQSTLTPTQTPSITVTNTITPTLTPTNTATGVQFTIPPTHTPTNTFTPTNTPSLTPVPTSTPTITATATASLTPSLTPTVGEQLCGDGIIQSPEECDDGGSCVGGDNNGQKCPAGQASVPGGVNCGAAGICEAFGGDGCANNCTTESVRRFTFSGEACSGGPQPGQFCTNYGETGTVATQATAQCGLNGTCAGVGECLAPVERLGQSCPVTTNSLVCLSGAAKGRQCSGASFSSGKNDCRVCPSGADAGKPCDSPPGTNGCAGGVACPTLVCATGAKVGNACTEATKVANCGAGVTCSTILVCNGPDLAKIGNACHVDADCGTSAPVGSCGSICANPCGPSSKAPSCLSKSRARLESASISISIGPIGGYQDFATGKPSPDGRIPVAVNKNNVHFEPIRVVGLACACVRGGVDATIHGPGNSASGYIGCGTSGLQDIDVFLAIDHNTTPVHKCLNGPKANSACTTDDDCSLVGTCPDHLHCVGGPNPGGACTDDPDCQTFAICNTQGPGVCGAGSTPAEKIGALCKANTDCGAGVCEGLFTGGGLCVGGSNNRKRCNSADPLVCPGGVCVSPDDPTCSAAEPLPERARRIACVESKEICTAGTAEPGSPCTEDADCGVGGACGNACNATSPHLNVCNSPVHFIRSGGMAEKGSGFLLNTSAIGVIVDGGSCSTDMTANGKTLKGPDGIPCTADDPPGSFGTAQTLPTTTGTAGSVLVDGSAYTGGVFINGQCTGTGVGKCNASITGSKFDCAALMSNPTGGTTGSRIATSFPQIEAATTGDNTVITVFTAR